MIHFNLKWCGVGDIVITMVLCQTDRELLAYRQNLSIPRLFKWQNKGRMETQEPLIRKLSRITVDWENYHHSNVCGKILLFGIDQREYYNFMRSGQEMWNFNSAKVFIDTNTLYVTDRRQSVTFAMCIYKSVI